ncbi:MAG TPA: SusD/RagB family nutrient-binding outer membrane lipoprotein [Bacteroidales bacterium]|nr:SusD/RagB family nutrient-binding outer membrane lipoprotein [Bacteroidales bacterium]
MKNSIIFIIFGLFLTISCTKDFDEINTNPNVAETVDPDFLFPTSVLNTATLLLDMEYEAGWTYGMYWTESGGAFVNFGTVDITVQGWWRRFYIRTLAGLSKIQQMYETDPTYKNRVLISKIWESYIYSQMVSYWGPIPFTDAINEQVTSVYDDETTIYHTLINDLIACSDSIDLSGDTYMTTADLIYEGDLVKWKKFARSLALRLAMQIMHNDSEFAGPVLTELLSAPDELISSNADNAIFQWYPGSESWNPLYQRFEYSPGDRKVNISEFLYLHLEPYADPRLSVYAEAAAANGEYSGRPITKSSLPPGLVLPSNPHSSMNDNDYSKPGELWFKEDGFLSLLLYPEICFLRAEAAYLGLSGETARTLYYAGIDASMLMLGKEAKAEQYKAVNGVMWGTFGAGASNSWLSDTYPEYEISSEIKNPYKQIIIQSWLAMYPRGLDAWTLFRRTGIVDMPVIYSADPSNTEIPTFAPVPERLKYPTEEMVYNNTGYNQGVSFLGNGDYMYTPLVFSANK